MLSKLFQRCILNKFGNHLTSSDLQVAMSALRQTFTEVQTFLDSGSGHGSSECKDRNLRASKAPLEDQEDQGISLFISAASNQIGFSKE